MKPQKMQDISPAKDEETLTAADLSQEDGEDDLTAQPKTPADYLESIMADVRKLSGIVDVIATLDQDKTYQHHIDFDNLAFAMNDFTGSINDLAEELYDHLRKVGTLHTKLAPAVPTGKAKEGRG